MEALEHEAQVVPPQQRALVAGLVLTALMVPLARAMARKLADPAMYLKRHFKQLAKHFGEEAVISEDVKK